MSALAPALQAFLTNRLIIQRDSSPRTIAAYRDAFTLLLRFAHDQTGKQPFELDIDDLDAPLIGAFLTHLERDRGNSARTRNARLGAIHSFYRFAALLAGMIPATPTASASSQSSHQRRSPGWVRVGEVGEQTPPVHGEPRGLVQSIAVGCRCGARKLGLSL